MKASILKKIYQIQSIIIKTNDADLNELGKDIAEIEKKLIGWQPLNCQSNQENKLNKEIKKNA